LESLRKGKCTIENKMLGRGLIEREMPQAAANFIHARFGSRVKTPLESAQSPLTFLLNLRT
jgi:hypothetical protein